MLVRHDAKLDKAVVVFVSTYSIHHTGLAKVTQSMLFRGIANVEDNAFLYDPHTCVVGGAR